MNSQAGSRSTVESEIVTDGELKTERDTIPI
jgi:hypothetical protein